MKKLSHPYNPLLVDFMVAVEIEVSPYHVISLWNKLVELQGRSRPYTEEVINDFASKPDYKKFRPIISDFLNQVLARDVTEFDILEVYCHVR